MEKVPFVDNIKELDEFIGICAVEKDLPDSLNFLKRFKIISRIDKGAHGQIMLARDFENNKLVAIKFMPRDQRHKSKFDKEINVFKTLAKYETYPVGFPELVYEGKTEHFYYYVMEKLGKSLKKVHSNCKNSKMDLKNVLNIGLQLVDRLETMHNVGLVHKDLKPANICFGLENPEDPSQDKSKILYLIDFGLTKQASEVRVRKFREDFLKPENLRLTGTPIYASINSHMGTTQCYK